jgi:hypothetical protein
MRLPPPRRTIPLLAALAVLGAPAIAFGPIVRGRLAAEAQRRHVDLTVGGVRPGWWSVKLTDVHLRPWGVDGVEASLREVHADLTWRLQLDRVHAQQGEVVVHGDLGTLREQLGAWRASMQTTSASHASGRTVALVADDLALRWVDGTGSARAELSGVSLSRGADGLQVGLASGRVNLGKLSLEATGGSFSANAGGFVSRAHAATLVAEWMRPPPEPAGSPGDVSTGVPSQPPVVVARVSSRHARPGTPSSPDDVDPSAPLLRLPDLHVLRGEISVFASWLADRIPVGAEADVGAMTLKVAPRNADSGVAFTIGPGPVSLSRSPSQFDLRFATDTDSQTCLSTRVLLPTDGGDLSASLEGGPVSLSLLGIHEGAAGLVDVARATVTGKARVVLAGDGTGASFETHLGTRGLSVREPRLALDVVRGVDLDIRATGAVTDGGEMRLDEFAATLGAMRLTASGTLDQRADHAAGSLRFELPATACQSLLDSVPTAFFPALSGTRMSGTFGARGDFAFDTRALDDLQLVYDIQDACRIAVPPMLAREHFKAPFAQRIYLPDGSTSERTTGPGTADWTSLDNISPYMQVAVMTTEDGAFRKHRGFNRAAIRASLIANLKARRFVRGASTITMQLAKNLFLSRDKTLARKVQEIVLTDYLEDSFTKDELVELYLNVVEFGPAVYGVTSAAEYYFGRTPAELSLAESLFLSSLLPSPVRYGAMREADRAPDGWLRALRGLMTIANKRGLITDAELAEGLTEPIIFWHGGERPPPRPHVRRPSLDGASDDDVPDPFEEQAP